MMKMPPPFTFSAITIARLIRWHRRIGIIVALFILMLAATGILLNHSSELNLDKRPVNSAVLSQWYGVEIPENIKHFKTSMHVVSQLGSQLYLDGRKLISTNDELIGATSNQHFIVIAVERMLYLVTREGDIIEQITDLPNSPELINAVGTDTNGHISIRLGNEIVTADTDLIEWQSNRNNSAVSWSKPNNNRPAFEQRILADQQQSSLHLERLILDLHSGRLFGTFGPYLMDAVAVAMILLALTGVYRWLNSITHKYR